MGPRPPMKCSIFATVGTTSFDDFVQSLCSLPFLTAMANHHYRVNYEIETIEAALPLPSQTLNQTYSLPSSNPEENNESSLDLTIQYGRGQCPTSFIPQCLLNLDKSIPQPNVGTDEGTILLSIPINPTSTTEQTFVPVQIRYFRFQSSLDEQMERADIILCHAGAGTLLEALSISSQSEQKTPSRRKIINAVINSKLMHNHQSELADELEMNGHISVARNCASEWSTEGGANTFWEMIRKFKPMPFLGGRRAAAHRVRVDDRVGHVRSFRQILDDVMGLDEKNYDREDSIKKRR